MGFLSKGRLFLGGLVAILLMITAFQWHYMDKQVTARAGLRLNEIMASNHRFFDPMDNMTKDWVELYNGSDEAIALGGYTLTDDAKVPDKWAFPEKEIIEPGAYLVIYLALGEETTHTGFSLKAGEEALLLYDQEGQEIDRLLVPKAISDLTYGYTSITLVGDRATGQDSESRADVDPVWLLRATPGQVNAGWFQYNEVFEQAKVEPPVPSKKSGIYGESIEISLSAESGALIYYTLDGSKPNEKSHLYSEPLILTAKDNPNQEAYRTDFSFYTNPENDFGKPAGQVDKGIVLRAVAYIEGQGLSEILTETYLDQTEFGGGILPIVSIVSEPVGLFDQVEGIYVLGDVFKNNKLPFPQGDSPANYNQRGMAWEREVSITLLEADGGIGFQETMGMRTYGAWSRANAHKGLRFIARDLYGTESLTYDLFEGLTDANGDPLLEYETFLLRAGGNDWQYTLFRDAFMQDITTSVPYKHTLSHQAYRPAIVLINGEYWGIHNFREAIDTKTLEAHFGSDEDNFAILEGDILSLDKEGLSNEEKLMAERFSEALEAAMNEDVTQDWVYEIIEERVDLQNYAWYMAAQTYLGNTDWPGNNIKYWAYVGKDVNQDYLDGRVRYWLYDTDFGYHLYGAENNATFDTISFATNPNGQEWPNPPWSTQFFRNLLRNETFKNLMTNTYADMLNTSLYPYQVKKKIDAYRQGIEGEVDRHQERWQSIWNFDGEVNRLYDFGEKRWHAMWGLIEKHLSNGERVLITLQGPLDDRTCLNDMSIFTYIDQETFKGYYYTDVPIKLSVDGQGEDFVGWTGIDPNQIVDGAITDPKITVLPYEGMVVQAIFNDN